MVSTSVTRAKTAKPPGKKGLWHWLKLSLSIIAWQVIALLVVELVLLWAGLGEEEIFAFDAELGTRHMADKHVTWRSEGYARSYFNFDGLREPGLTISKARGVKRVALLGDSMVEGLQVPIEQTFGQMLSARLSSRLRAKVEVINFATSGYSTTQQYLQLKRQVVRYKPDLVLLCYNSRDMFENWSPPDQVLTNVRPVAIHLPGGNLTVSTKPVTDWLKTPRARYLQQVDWLRHHSRIWGLVSALELDLSLHNPVYRAFLLISRPRKAIQELTRLLQSSNANEPSFQIQFFEANKASSRKRPQSSGAESCLTAEHTAIKPTLNSAAPNAVLERGAEQALSALERISAPEGAPAHIRKKGNNMLWQDQARTDSDSIARQCADLVLAADARNNTPPASDPKGRRIYAELITRTFTSLLREMAGVCTSHGARLAVITTPARAALCPSPGMETAFNYIDYPGEIAMLRHMCLKLNLPLHDCQSSAEQLPEKARPELFYAVHLTPRGHTFLADTLQPFLEHQLKR